MGAGRVGTAFGALLRTAGWRLTGVSGGERSRERAARHLPGIPFDADAAATAEVVLLAVPDDAISEVCGAIAWRPGQLAVHLAGSVSLDALEPARRAGARVCSVHPLQTFPDVDVALARLPGSAMAVTAPDDESFALGEGIARAVGGEPFRLQDDRKPLYHAAAVFASNYLAVVQGIAEDLLQEAGVDRARERLTPLARVTLDNVHARGPAAALTGPAARGDAGTVRAHLEALSREAPSVVAPYVALAAAAVELAVAAGTLEPAAGERVKEALAPWR